MSCPRSRLRTACCSPWMLLTWLVGTAGCLPEPTPVAGLQLYSGRQIENIEFTRIDDSPWVQFRQRRQLPEPGRQGSYDLALVPADGSQGVSVLARNLWDEQPPRPMGGGQYWVFRDVRTRAGATQVFQVGTLSRVGLREGLIEDVPDVVQWSFLGDIMWWKSLRAGEAVPSTFIRRGAEVRALPDIIGTPSVLGGQITFVAGEAQTLYRLANFDARPEPVRSGVSRLREPSGGPLAGRYVAMVVPEGNTAAHVIFDLVDRSERKLPGDQICCWLGFEGSEFVYAEGASKDQTVRLHRYDVLTAAHEVIYFPPGLVDVVSFVARPGGQQRLLLDSRNAAAVLDPAANPPVRVLGIRPLGPQFSPDGRFLLFVEPEAPPDGRLMSIDGDFVTPPTAVTPIGTTLRPGNYFWMTDRLGTKEENDDRLIIVFWARFGRAASDLYFSDVVTREVTRVAPAIRQVSVTPDRVFGILRTSQQDLVGDLARSDLATGEEVLYAHSVDSFVIGAGKGETDPDLMVFYVRNRAPTDQDGLWITPLR